MTKIPFAKPAISVDDQLQKMEARGLIIKDRSAAKHYIEHIGYYRLSGYALPFQNGGRGLDRHEFHDETTFDMILDCYIFDRKFRLLLLDAIERIEVSVRAALSNSIAVRHAPNWYQNRAVFNSRFSHADYIEEIKRQIGHKARTKEQINRRAIFINHFYGCYNSPDMPPSWMIFEEVSFGVISKTVEGLLPRECQEICSHLRIPHTVLTSWLHSISYVRNLCAHHSRVWNRKLTIKPKVAKKFKTETPDNSNIYAILVIVQILLERIAPDNHWAERLVALLNEHPNIPRAAMGFPEDWMHRPIWRLAT